MSAVVVVKQQSLLLTIVAILNADPNLGLPDFRVHIVDLRHVEIFWKVFSAYFSSEVMDAKKPVGVESALLFDFGSVRSCGG